MLLKESDPSLSDLCRAVEEGLAAVSALSSLTLPVRLLPSFDDEPEARDCDAYRRTPAAYRQSIQTVLVNGREFMKLVAPTAEVIIVHETGHAYLDLIDPNFGRQAKFACLHEDQVADFLVCKWGFEKNLAAERIGSYGAEYCDALRAWENQTEYLRLMSAYLIRKRSGLV